MDNNLCFKVIFIIEVLCREDKYVILKFGRSPPLPNKKGTFNVSLMREISNDHYHKTFNLIKSQLELLLKLLNEDIQSITDNTALDELDWEYYYKIRVDKYVVKAFMNDFQKSLLWEEYISYKIEKDKERKENLLKYPDINPIFLNKDPYYLNKNKFRYRY